MVPFQFLIVPIEQPILQSQWSTCPSQLYREPFCLFCECLPVRQNQVRPGSVSRFPNLLMHGKIRGWIYTWSSRQGAVLLILGEGTGRNREASGWVQISNVCQLLSLLACDFVSHDIVKHVTPKRIKLEVASVLTEQSSRFLTYVSESSFRLSCNPHCPLRGLLDFVQAEPVQSTGRTQEHWTKSLLILPKAYIFQNTGNKTPDESLRPQSENLNGECSFLQCLQYFNHSRSKNLATSMEISAHIVHVQIKLSDKDVLMNTERKHPPLGLSQGGEAWDASWRTE